MRMPPDSHIVAVFGAALCDNDVYELARAVGSEIARRNAALICGGLGGVMEASARGAREAGGLTIGVLPGPDRKHANPYIQIPIITNMGHARNIILAHTCEGGISVAGSLGTLSEIAITLKLGKPVVELKSWRVDPGIISAESPRDAVAKLFDALNINP